MFVKVSHEPFHDEVFISETGEIVEKIPVPSVSLDLDTSSQSAEQKTAVRLTERQHVALLYLSDKMEASASMVGAAVVIAMDGRGGSNLSAVGASVLSGLRKQNLVTYLPDMFAWRITSTGRESIAHDTPARQAIERATKGEA